MGTSLQYNSNMEGSPVGSFARFLIGFLTFISVSFGVTIAVNSYAGAQDAERQAAAALQAMLEVGK